MRWDCQRYGWVLTGFHETKILNSLVTPPNRIILFEINATTCMTRVTSRSVNMYTGEIYTTNPANEKESKQAKIHPRDNLNPVFNEVGN